MIIRRWRGAVARADGDAYVAYVDETGIAAYAATPGNRGAWLLRRDVGDLVEIVTLSQWESMEAIRAFAGSDVERAVFYPEDDRWLVERDAVVTHHEVAAHRGPQEVSPKARSSRGAA